MKRARSSGTTHAVAMFESSIYVLIRNKLPNVVYVNPFPLQVEKYQLNYIVIISVVYTLFGGL